MRKFITIYNLDFLTLTGNEYKILTFMLWHRDANKANKTYASTSKISEACDISQRGVFNCLSGLADKGWIERVDGQYFINAESMSLMVDVKNKGIQPKTEARSDKEYIQNPEIRAAFKQMFPDKKVDKILDNLYRTTEKPIRNWHEFAKACIAKSDLTKPKVIKSKGYGQDNGMEWD